MVIGWVASAPVNLLSMIQKARTLVYRGIPDLAARMARFLEACGGTSPGDRRACYGGPQFAVAHQVGEGVRSLALVCCPLGGCQRRFPLARFCGLLMLGDRMCMGWGFGCWILAIQGLSGVLQSAEASRVFCGGVLTSDPG